MNAKENLKRKQQKYLEKIAKQIHEAKTQSRTQSHFTNKVGNEKRSSRSIKSQFKPHSLIAIY